MIDIFEHGEDEKLVKFYHSTRGHNQGEIEPINLLISSYGIYILVKNEIKPEVETISFIDACAPPYAHYHKSVVQHDLHSRDLHAVLNLLDEHTVGLTCAPMWPRSMCKGKPFVR